jgi:hypothetical protein
MQRARAFFYVCAGIFLLALSYHLGARGAAAQAFGFRVLGENGPFVAVGETVFKMDFDGWWSVPTDPAHGSDTLPPVPVSSLVLYLGSEAITQTGEGCSQARAPGIASGQFQALRPLASRPGASSRRPIGSDDGGPAQYPAVLGEH